MIWLVLRERKKIFSDGFTVRDETVYTLLITDKPVLISPGNEDLQNVGRKINQQSEQWRQ